MTTTLTTEPTYYEVLWGIEYNERKTYVDNGDSSAASEHAEALATRELRDLSKNGRKAGFFVNGVHKAGHDFEAEFAAADEQYAAENTPAPVEHKTRTFLDDHGTHLNWRKIQVVGGRAAWAVCTCGWKTLRDNRDLARRAARSHREESATTQGAAA